MSKLSVNHLLGIKYLNKKDIALIFETADHFKEVINRSAKNTPLGCRPIKTVLLKSR